MFQLCKAGKETAPEMQWLKTMMFSLAILWADWVVLPCGVARMESGVV